MNNIQDKETNIVRDEELEKANGGLALALASDKGRKVTCSICRRTFNVTVVIKSGEFVCPDCKKR